MKCLEQCLVHSTSHRRVSSLLRLDCQQVTVGKGDASADPEGFLSTGDGSFTCITSANFPNNSRNIHSVLSGLFASPTPTNHLEGIKNESKSNETKHAVCQVTGQALCTHYFVLICTVTLGDLMPSSSPLSQKGNLRTRKME